MPGRLLFLFVLTRTLSILFFSSKGDVELYYRWLAHIQTGELPFQDFLVEYPPLALAYTLIPSLEFPETFGEFHQTFRLLSYAIDALCFFLAAQIFAPKALSFYILSTFALGPVVYDRIDVGLALLFLLTLHALRNNRPLLAHGLLGVGFSFKLIPGIAAPAMLARTLRACGIAHATRCGALLFLLATTPFLLCYTLFGQGVFALFNYHFERGIQIESIWSNAQLLALWSNAPDFVVFRHGCHNLATPASHPLLTISSVLGVAVIAASLQFGWRGRANIEQILAWTIVAFVAVGKVLSPQFFVFLVPLFLVLSRGREWYEALIVLVCALTTVVFPFRYDALREGSTDAILALTCRNALLLFLCGFSFIELLRARESDSTCSPITHDDPDAETTTQ